MHELAEPDWVPVGARIPGDDPFTPASVLIAGEVRIHCDGLVLSLARHTGLRVVGAAADLEEAIAGVRTLRPQIVVFDFEMHGSELLVQQILDLAPGSVMIAFGVREMDRRAVSCAEAGVLCLPRGGSMAELLAVLDTILSGASDWFRVGSASPYRRMAVLAGERQGSDNAVLTRRERQILQLLDLDASNKEISRRLQIKLSTVKNHVHSILKKLQVPRRSMVVNRMRSLA